MTDDWKPDARTVQLCIEALPNIIGDIDHDNAEMRHRAFATMICRDNLQALLPKPDPAKALMEEYLAAPKSAAADTSGHNLLLGIARCLSETGRLRL